jgi:antitoxin (DNA-binding transcriptional repressor) of toxin-antitoxin stability system
MSTVSIPEATTQLAELVELAERGEDTILLREGKPVARLTRLEAVKRPIRYGALQGKIWIAEDFDAPLPEDILIVPEA